MSQDRKEKKYISLEKLDEVKIHKCCQSNYTRKRSIETAVRKFTEAYGSRRRQLAVGRQFNFAEQCFFLW